VTEATPIEPGEIDAGLEGMAAQLGVRLFWKDLGRLKGEYWHRTRTIAISPRCSGVQARCTLAHELGHAVNGDDAAAEAVTEAQEHRASMWAALTLIDLGEYAKVEGVYGEHPGTIARELSVTVDIVMALRSSFARARQQPTHAVRSA
jgi:Zn-dependent peptidase ImmA (M78 family)